MLASPHLRVELLGVELDLGVSNYPVERRDYLHGSVATDEWLQEPDLGLNYPSRSDIGL